MPYDSIIDRNDASALIPEEVRKGIIQDLPAQSIVLSNSPRVMMSRNQQRMPVLAALPYAYFVSGDTGVRQTTDVSWTNKYLNAEELAVIVPVPKKVLADSDFDIWAEIRPRLITALGKAIDQAIFFGVNKPSSWPSSIIAAAQAAGNYFVRGSVSQQDLGNDVSALMSLVENDGFEVNGFAARVAIKGGLRGLRDQQGALLFQPSLQSGTPSTLYGEPIMYSRNGAWDNTAADLIGGDWTQMILGIREDISFEMGREGVIQGLDGQIVYNLFQQAMVALTVTIRVAFEVANPIKELNENASTRYPFGVLRPVGWTP